MNVAAYRRRRESLLRDQPRYRQLCVRCLQPDFSCYCVHVQRFDPKIKFVILIHPIEVRRRIATGRMSYLCLENSELLMGQDYSNRIEVNRLIGDSENSCCVLYPGVGAKNLSQMESASRSALFEPGKRPVIFVIDGTWATARRTVRLSQNLAVLPRICFTPGRESRFRVRKQPKTHCVSTIEAIHEVIDLLGEREGFAWATGVHHGLMHVFDQMVERQLTFVKQTRRPFKKRSIEKEGIE